MSSNRRKINLKNLFKKPTSTESSRQENNKATTRPGQTERNLVSKLQGLNLGSTESRPQQGYRRISRNALLVKNLERRRRKSEYFSNIIDLFLDRVVKKRGNREENLSTQDKLFIYQNIFNFFIEFGYDILTAKDVIDRENICLIPISIVLSEISLNNVNMSTAIESRGARGLVRTNDENPALINKYLHLKIKNNIREQNINMGILRNYLTNLIVPTERGRNYNRAYQRLLYKREENFVPGNILIESLIQEICYHVKPNFVPRIDKLVFYKKICKIKMKKIDGYEFSKFLSIRNSNNISPNTKLFLQNNFSIIVQLVFENLKDLQDRINFVHFDLHFNNIMICKNNFNVETGEFLFPDNLIKLIDYGTSSLVVPLINKDTMGIETKYIKMYEDSQKFYWLEKFKNPYINPNLMKITDAVKFFTSILYGNKNKFRQEENSRSYVVSPEIANLIISRLGINGTVDDFKTRINRLLPFYTSYLRRYHGIEPLQIHGGQRVNIYFYELIHNYTNYNYLLRNYVFFNIGTISNQRDFNNIVLNEQNFIQPSLNSSSVDPYGIRFTCDNIIRLFSLPNNE